ncbi:MAG: flavodoxin [Methanomassiliicoccales archaeon PtaB.Bin215]|nr:MAG: flavodoxin [Methanomassiliicoccales archaeon PtaB.Bin215]
MNALVVLLSYHHHNTKQVADVIARVIGAEVRAPQDISPGELSGYDLLGMASGIYSGRHHQSLLDLAEALPPVTSKRAFLFSTSSAVMVGDVDSKLFQDYVGEIHAPLRGRLISKGYTIIGKFSCPGFNTNSFIRHFGGLNKGRPNAEDLSRAEVFARRVLTEAMR